MSGSTSLDNNYSVHLELYAACPARKASTMLATDPNYKPEWVLLTGHDDALEVQKPSSAAATSHPGS